METQNFFEKIKEKGSYYLIILVLLVIAAYLGFLFYMEKVAMGERPSEVPARPLEKSTLSDLKLNDLEKSNYYKFQALNQENYPDKLPDESPYNEKEINLQRDNPFLEGQGTVVSKKATESVEKSQNLNQQAPIQAQQETNNQIMQSQTAQFVPLQTQEENFGAPSSEDLNFNFTISN